MKKRTFERRSPLWDMGPPPLWFLIALAGIAGVGTVAALCIVVHVARTAFA